METVLDIEKSLAPAIVRKKFRAEVSDSTLEYDRETKKILYAESGIAEFWLINLKHNVIEFHTSPKNGNYQSVNILKRGETVQSEKIEKLTLQVEEIIG